ncbi:MAG: LysM domain-containing protein [Chthoniobacterales bacterium]
MTLLSQRIPSLLTWVCLLAVGVLTVGCDKLALPRVSKKADAEEAESAKDYPRAIRFYEASLDGTAATADLHYRLAVIYDDKLHDSVAALHHYRRYLSLKAKGAKVEEIKRSVKRIEAVMVGESGDGGPVPRSEAVRLKNENMALRQENAELKSPENKQARDSKGFSSNPATAKAEKKIGKETKTYVVQKGDTLAAISRKFYKTSVRWKDIADANHNQLGGKENLTVGMTLIIPK